MLNSSLVSKAKGHSDSTYLRKIIQTCFNQAIEHLQRDGHTEEADLLNEATVHWLCHTEISDDVKHSYKEKLS